MCKTCTKCKMTKELDAFGVNRRYKDGLSSECKSCILDYRKSKRISQISYQRNKEKVIARYIANREKIAVRRKLKYEADKLDKDKYSAYLEKAKIRYEANKQNKKSRREAMTSEDRKLINEKIRAYRNSDPLVKLGIYLRNRTTTVFKAKGRKKKLKSLEYIGCSLEFLKSHIQAQFKEGMTWENNTRFGWHVDHKIPLASATTEDEIKALCHYSNLQPLWWNENLSKQDKMPEEWAKSA